MIKLLHNQPLAPYTTFGVGGPAEHLAIIDSSYDLEKYIQRIASGQQFHIIGYGANSLIADRGLSGNTVINQSKKIVFEDNCVTADSGVWWDDLVKATIEQNLYGLELTSAIPGSVGAGVYGNIAAYGQAVADTLLWVEFIDLLSLKKYQLSADQLKFDYRSSEFQNPTRKNCIILRACFKLQTAPTHQLTYSSALKIADRLQIKPDSLKNRRRIILEARKEAGSIYEPNQNYEKTAGSFFRNPIVTSQQLEMLAEFDEKNSPSSVKSQNQAHSGNANRVSASLVLLAAGFKRGQTWGQVRLHQDHVLKIENIGQASAQDIYNVGQYIKKTVHQKFQIELQPEVQFLGKFGEYHEPTE